MSFEKAIIFNKTHRKQYRNAKLISRSCRNHGTCPFCSRNRLKNTYKEKEYLRLISRYGYDVI